MDKSIPVMETSTQVFSHVLDGFHQNWLSGSPRGQIKALPSLSLVEISLFYLRFNKKTGCRSRITLELAGARNNAADTQRIQFKENVFERTRHASLISPSDKCSC